MGECAREGRWKCQDSGLDAICDVVSGEPTKEVCNGKDDDCNGLVDDNLGDITCGVGACKRIVPACV